MVAAFKTVIVRPGGEVGKLLKQADVEPVVVEQDGVRYRVTREPDDLFADYDPKAARAALNRVFGLLKGVDTEALKAELRAQREQDSLGRPA